LQDPPLEDSMTRLARTLMAVMFGGSLLFAQLPNPLGLPDPLGLSKKPAPSGPRPAPRRAERRPEPRQDREARRDKGRHKGHDKRENHKREERSGHDRH
jgi:hypothetical protein